MAIPPPGEADVPRLDCPGASPHGRRVDLGAFARLHPDGRELIQGWFRRADEALALNLEGSFEAFIFVWFAYNGWAACCSGIDQDRDQCRALASSVDLTRAFANLLNEERGFCDQATEFRDLWPIFKAQELRRHGVQADPTRRRDVVERYLAADPRISREPSCYDKHRARMEAVPVDWPHTLLATYQVRCNLFHGEKAAHSEMDRMIVAAALRTLIPFLRRYLLA